MKWFLILKTKVEWKKCLPIFLQFQKNLLDGLPREEIAHKEEVMGWTQSEFSSGNMELSYLFLSTAGHWCSQNAALQQWGTLRNNMKWICSGKEELIEIASLVWLWSL